MAFPTDDVRVQAAETALGRTFPAALRSRLLRDNGGDVDADDDGWQLHAVWDDSDRRRAGRTATHVVRETEAARECGWFPAGALAIAANGTGDLLVVLGDDEAVMLWEHDTGDLHPVDVDWE